MTSRTPTYHFQDAFDTKEEADEYAKTIIPPVVVGTPLEDPAKFGVWAVR